MKSRPIASRRCMLLVMGMVLALVAPRLALAQTEPDTTITGYPVALGLSRLDASTFSFVSSIEGSTFECSLDGVGFVGCTGPMNYPSLANGSHTFQVRAVYGGVPDPSPASLTWTVSQYEQWSREVLGNVPVDTIDSPLGSAIALDSQGDMHVVFATTGDVVYAAWNPTSKAWEISVIDTYDNVNMTMGEEVSLALDAEDHPRITYYRAITNLDPGLYYAEWDGTAWTKTLVDAASGYLNYHGCYNSLALDASGQPHIAYYNKWTWNSGEMRYADWNGTGFDIQSVSTTGGSGGLSLAVTASGAPRIAYCENPSSPTLLKYAAWNGTGWDTQTVDSLGSTGWMPSLKLDGSGNPRISYLSPTGSPDEYELRYAAWNGASWDLQLVGLALYARRTSLALDSAGHPHVGFKNTDWNPGYAAWDGQAWRTEQIVATDGTVEASCSVVLDSSDRAHFSVHNASWEVFAYEKALAGTLAATVSLTGHSYPIDAQLQVCLSGGTIGSTPDCQAATGNGGTVEWPELMPGSDYTISGGANPDWATPTPQTGLAVYSGQTTQVAVGFEYTGSAEPDTTITGRPMFDRRNSSSDATFQFEPSQTECTFECSLDGAGFAACTSPMTYSSLSNGSHNFEVRAKNYRAQLDPSPASFTWSVDSEATWQLAALADTWSYVQGRIVFDSTGNPWGVYSIGDTSQGSSSYFTPWTGLTWDTRLFAEPAKQPILVFGENGTMSVACISWSIWFDTWDGTRWTIENIPTEEQASGIDMKLDSTGKPHVAFMDDVLGDGNIKYATPGERDWQGNRSWNVELIATGAGLENPRPSLVLDASDTPRIAWEDTGGVVYYAVRSGGSWTIETVADVEHNYHPYASLVLGSDDRPRVAFCEQHAVGGGSNLWYAARSDAGWNTEAVAHWADNANCQAPSLALDADGHPHIAVFNWQGGPEYVSWSGTTWERQVVESFTLVDYESGIHLVLDAEARPNIIYHSTGGSWMGKVIYARGPAEAPPGSPPVVTLDPVDQSVYVGDTASFSAAATGDPAPTVQWQASTDGGNVWTDIPGADQTTYEFTAAYDQNGYQYHAVFTNDLGSATSGAATLTVSKHQATVTLSDLQQTYDGQPRPVTVATDPPGLTVVVTYDGSEMAPIHAGSYAVVATVVDDAYEGSASGTLTVVPREIEVTAGPKAKVAGDPDPELTYRITQGSLVDGDAFTGALTRVPGEAVGIYPILQGTLALSGDYTLTYVGANLRIVAPARALYVSGIVLSYRVARDGAYIVTGLVTILTRTGAPADSAHVTVRMTLGDGRTGSLKRDTDPSGVATFAKKDGAGTYTLCVARVVKVGFVWLPGDDDCAGLTVP